MEAIVEFIMPMVAKYPAIATVLMIVGGLRVVFKPIMSVARAYVDYTSTDSDNKKLDEIESSRVYKGLAYVLDYMASIKLPVK